MLKTVQRLFAVLSLAALAVAFAPGARAGTVILEGSDAVGFHCTGNNQAGACTYRDELFTAIGGSDSRDIAIFSDLTVGSGSHPVSNFTSLGAAGSLSNYVALDFLSSDDSGPGCCQTNDVFVSTQADRDAISAYVAGGGTVVINDYTGSSAWDFLLGTSGGATAHVAGYAGGAGGASCSDGETVTAVGVLNGFVQPPAISCWTHQSYDTSYFSTLGFDKSFFDAPSDIGGEGFSSLLSNGSTVTVTEAPEPATLAVLAMGIAGFGAIRRRRRA
jgi:hypothetical protein